jgi:hypothetical protein
MKKLLTKLSLFLPLILAFDCGKDNPPVSSDSTNFMLVNSNSRLPYPHKLLFTWSNREKGVKSHARYGKTLLTGKITPASTVKTPATAYGLRRRLY